LLFLYTLLIFTLNYATIITANKEVHFMPNIKPVSDLRNYNAVLNDISEGEPVFLTKNGRGRYVILDIDDYEKQRATLKLLSELNKAEKSAETKGWLSEAEADKAIGDII
jgi:antitoxin Phd